MSAKNLFADEPAVHDAFFAVWNKIRSIYTEAELEVFEETVVIKDNNRPFCWIWAPAPGNDTYGDCPIVVSFGLNYKVQPHRLCRCVQAAPDRWMYHCGIEKDLGLCDTVLSLIDRAHKDKVDETS